jgi:hypothetical protein
MSNPFWTNEQAWPRDPTGYVFLARAFNRIGSAKFGQEWTGQEGSVRLPELLPEKLYAEDITSDTNARYWLSLDAQASKALNEREIRVVREQTMYKVAKAKFASLTGPKPDEPKETSELTPQEWMRAKEINKAEYDRSLPLWTRARTVQTAVIEACEQGRLVSFHRPAAGGEMVAIPPVWWNADDVARWRFSSCSIDPTDVFRNQPRPSNHHWIYLSDDSLANFLSQQPNSDIRAHFDVHLSPYLALMLSVAKKLEITPDNQPKKDVVVAELKDAWPEGAPPSPTLAEYMATALREIDSQGGRNKRNKKPD